MKERKLLFFFALSLNILSFIITLHLLKIGAIEGNPIMAKLFSNGIPFALIFITSIWFILYIILIYFPEKSKDKLWIKASKYACAILLIMISIDFLNDYIWLVLSS